MGVTPEVRVPSGKGIFIPRRGIVIPWSGREGRLALVQVRQPDGSKPRYAEVFRDPSAITGLYPGPEVIRVGRPLVVAEGAFDGLLLGQVLEGLAAVVTLGSASMRPTPALMGRMLAAAPWLIATDADGAGDRAAADWPPAARRVRPPAPYNDWCEANAAGVDLGRWWRDIFADNASPQLFTNEEASSWRWGPAPRDGSPGIDARGSPDRSRLVGTLSRASDHLDPEEREERLAIAAE